MRDLSYSQVEYRYGKDIDIYFLKQNVLTRYNEEVIYWKKKAEMLKPYAQPVANCILCGSDSSERVGHIYGWPWYQCKNCTHVYNGLRLPKEKYFEFYKEVDAPINYSDTYTDERVQKYRMESVAKPKIEYILNYASKGNRKLLDVAAGNGDALYLAKQMGFDVVKGIEINSAAVKFGKEYWGVDIYEGIYEDFERENTEKWDVITFLGILDIIPNPVEYVKITYRLLSQGGIAVFDIPNYNSLSRYVQFTYSDQLVCRFLYPSVISSYTEESISQLLRKEGFDVIAVWYYGMDFYELINNLSYSDERFRNSKINELLRNNINELQNIFDKQKMGDDLFVIAKKK